MLYEPEWAATRGGFYGPQLSCFVAQRRRLVSSLAETKSETSIFFFCWRGFWLIPTRTTAWGEATAIPRELLVVLFVV